MQPIERSLLSFCISQPLLAHNFQPKKKRKYSSKTSIRNKQGITQTRVFLHTHDLDIELNISLRKQYQTCLPQILNQIVFDYLGKYTTYMILYKNPSLFVTNAYWQGITRQHLVKRVFIDTYYKTEAPISQVVLIKDIEHKLNVLCARGEFEMASRIRHCSTWTNTCQHAYLKYHRDNIYMFQKLFCHMKIPRVSHSGILYIWKSAEIENLAESHIKTFVVCLSKLKRSFADLWINKIQKEEIRNKVIEELDNLES